MKKHILIVEDEVDIASALSARLKNEGFEVTVADNGVDGSDIADEQHFDLAILDIMLPGKNGLEIAKQLKDTDTAILVLSARDEEQDIIKGLDIGADDYVTKPFSIREVLARVNALLRRQAPQSAITPSNDRLQFGGLVIDIKRHVISVNDKDIKTTPTEFRLLVTLCTNLETVLTREQLVGSVLNIRDNDDKKNIRTIDSHIRSLRKKIGADYIRTVHGLGYIFEPQAYLKRQSA